MVAFASSRRFDKRWPLQRPVAASPGKALVTERLCRIDTV